MSLNFNNKKHTTLTSLYQEALDDIYFDNINLFNDRSLKKIAPRNVSKMIRFIEKLIKNKENYTKSEIVESDFTFVDYFLEKYSN